MKIFGVNIVYDKEETRQLRKEHKNSLSPEKLRRLRVYKVTDKYTESERYGCIFSPWGFLRVYYRRPAVIGGYRVETLKKWRKGLPRVCVCRRRLQIFFGHHPADVLNDLLEKNGFGVRVFKFKGSETDFYLEVRDLAGAQIDPVWIKAKSG